LNDALPIDELRMNPVPTPLQPIGIDTEWT